MPEICHNILPLKGYSMFSEQLKPVYDSSWEIPQSRYLVSFAKRRRYCVVVPVINEGVKIRKQLTEMHAIGIDSLADIVIADGGSTDGSLDFDFLKQVGVRALLVKQDTGKLSAQLRIAYAFGMTEGYEGVITIDGNGKDSVDSIPLFIKALDDGVDYAQGSRYVPGGHAVNTPLVRYLAMRLLHVPVVSLAAHRRLTDTTNGYRSYSRRYLLHPDVQPFRNIFQGYELLAYMSARASRLGLIVTEVPVTRIYPATGPVPTKISFVRGNAQLLKILFLLLRGEYEPTSKRRHV